MLKLIIKRKNGQAKMIEIDEEMEEWGTETAEGPKIWGGNSNILYLSAFVLFSIPAKSGWGGMTPWTPYFRRPREKRARYPLSGW